LYENKLIVLEDLSGFIDRTKDIEYFSDIDDPTFDAEFQKGLPNKELAKEVKRAWNAEADHNFMQSLIKIHWINSSEKNPEKKLDEFMAIGRKNEISTMGYLTNTQEIRSNWGNLGVVVQGRVTLAANNMNDIRSGFFKNGIEKYAEKYSSSGISFRLTKFKTKSAYSHEGSKKYILDRASFDPHSTRVNEFIVDNWKPIGFIVTKSTFDFLDWVSYAVKFKKKNNDMLKYAKAVIKYNNLPVYNENMEQIDKDKIEAALQGIN